MRTLGHRTVDVAGLMERKEERNGVALFSFMASTTAAALER